jgi:hypothetical protein
MAANTSSLPGQTDKEGKLREEVFLQSKACSLGVSIAG